MTCKLLCCVCQCCKIWPAEMPLIFPNCPCKPWTVSKHGVVGLTRVAAMELGEHGINVNTICPNHVTTGLGAWQNDHFSDVTGKGYEKYMADMRARIPMGRPSLQEDIAKACAFLCSDQASYITGECMNVSGGEEYH